MTRQRQTGVSQADRQREERQEDTHTNRRLNSSTRTGEGQIDRQTNIQSTVVDRLQSDRRTDWQTEERKKKMDWKADTDKQQSGERGGCKTD